MLTIEPGHGALALDLQQLIDTRSGWSIIDGYDIESESGFQITVTSGTALCDGVRRSHSSSSTQSLEPPDNEFPRRDVVYADRFGEVNIESGQPNPALPEDDSRFDCFSPWPYSMHDVSGVVLAEVWVAPGADGIGGSDIRDRRIHADVAFNTVSAKAMSVEERPTSSTDVVRLADLDDLGNGGGGGGGDVSNPMIAHLDAAGYSIENVGQLDVSNILISSPSSQAQAAVVQSQLDAYYERAGDSLAGDMDASGNDIESVGEMDAETVDATDNLFIPVHSSEPDSGNLWFRSDISPQSLGEEEDAVGDEFDDDDTI